MSDDPYAGKSPMDLAREAERDLNSREAQGAGHEISDSIQTESSPPPQISSCPPSRLSSLTTPLALESGVDVARAEKFPGGSVTYGSAASGRGDNREIPVEEGGDIQRGTGRTTKAADFEGEGGPEDKLRRKIDEQPGDDEIRGNVSNETNFTGQKHFTGARDREGVDSARRS
ncbi:MAG: hypothetical protein Q9227_001466 [Pyrenula ochraceoflavens]